MQDSINILKEVIRNENDVTRILLALCAYKNFREIFVRFLTSGASGAINPEEVSWEDMAVQATCSGSRPDFCILGKTLSLLMEIKTSRFTPLTAGQPTEYLNWLAQQTTQKELFFITLIPNNYIYKQELENRINNWRYTSKGPSITVSILTWQKFLEELDSKEIAQLNPYFSNFYDVLDSRFSEPIIKMNYLEVKKMYTKEAASGIVKLFKIVERVGMELENNNYQVENFCSNRWTDGSECGFNIKKGDIEYLWFGIWQKYWEHYGVPLCYGVQHNWRNDLVQKFLSNHPNCKQFPQGDPNYFYIVEIDENIFYAADPVKEIFDSIDKEISNLI